MRRTTVLALLLPLPATLLAQAAPPAPDTVRLPAVVVTATRTAASPDQVPNAVTVLSGNDLRERGITRVAEALREVPGLTVVQSGPAGGVVSLFMRGGESDYVRVLVDGVPANEPGGAIDLSNLTTSNVDRIEIVRGPASALFGSDAVSGVIQIFTRRATPGVVAANVEALGGGAGGSFGATARGGSRGGNAGWSLGASWLDEAGVWARNNRFRNWSGSGMVYAAGAAGDVQLAVRHDDGLYHFPTDGAGNPTDLNQYSAGRLTTVSLDGGRRVSSAVELRLLAGATSGVDDAVNPPDSANDPSTYSARTEYGRRSADVRTNVRLAATTLTAGVAGERETFRSSSDSIERTRTGGAGYAQVLAPLGPRIMLTAGGRAEDNDRFGRFATGRLGVVVRAAAATRLRLSAGTAFKEPTFLENYGGGWSTGNPSLAPERSRSIEAGVEQHLADGRLVVTATAFTQRFDSVIQYTYAVPAGQPNYTNVAGASARGLELDLRSALGHGVRVDAEWTWLHTAVTDSGVDGSTFAVRHPLLRRPAQSGSLALSRFAGRGDLSVRLLVVGRREDLGYDANFTPMRVVLPAYNRVDLGGTLVLLTAGDGQPESSALVRVENVLDTRYQEVRGFPARGRTVWLGLRLGRP